MDFLKSFDTEIIVTATAVIVAGMAAILGIWMERDERKPPRYAWALSALILLATGVSLMQSMLDKKEQDEIKEDMARLLATMDKIASESNDPALLDLVKTEINAQSRDNPDVVQKVAERVSEGEGAGLLVAGADRVHVVEGDVRAVTDVERKLFHLGGEGAGVGADAGDQFAECVIGNLFIMLLERSGGPRLRFVRPTFLVQ